MYQIGSSHKTVVNQKDSKLVKTAILINILGSFFELPKMDKLKNQPVSAK